MDFEIPQGRSLRIVIGPMTKANGSMVDLTSSALRLMAKPTITATDGNASIDYRLVVDGTGTPVSTPAGAMVFGRPSAADPDIMQDETVDSGYVTVTFHDEDTQGLGEGDYPWELVLLPNNGMVHQLRTGTITIVDTLIEDPETMA